MSALVERMRQQFKRLSAARTASGAWSDEDVAAMGESIRAAIGSGDECRFMDAANYLDAACDALDLEEDAMFVQPCITTREERAIAAAIAGRMRGGAR